MLVERETFVALFISLVAILVVVGGFASFTGLSVHEAPLVLNFHKASFSRGDVFDVSVDLSPATFLQDESLVIYVDEVPVSVVALQKYLDDNQIDYGLDFENAGKNNIKVMTLKNKLSVNLADFVSLDDLQPGSHSLKVSLSQGDASADGNFILE